MKKLTKIFLTIILTSIAIIPSLFIAGAYGLLDPVGFLQSFFVIGLGVWFLGGIQLFLFITWLTVMILLWN